MKFFFSRTELNFKFEENGYILNKKVFPFKEGKNQIFLDEIYFTNEPFLDSFIKNLPDKNKNIISIIPESQILKMPQFPKNLVRDTGLSSVLNDKKLKERNLINIAILNNLGKQDFETEKKIIEIVYNFFRRKFKFVNIHLFNGISLRLLDEIGEMPIISLFQEPESLEKLVRSDAFIDFDELRKLGAVDESLVKQFEERFQSDEPLVEQNIEEPLVSVIIPVYNREDYIGEAIESVLNQTYKNFELIIVNDGSTDNTENIVKGYAEKDKRIKYFYQENQGAYSARNKGIEESNGEFISFLDSDDKYFPYALEKMVYLFQTLPENVKLIYGNFINEIEGQKEKIYREIVEPAPKPVLFHQFLIGNPILPTTSMVRKDVFEEIGLFDDKRMVEDYNFWTKLILKYNIAKLNLPVSIYRKHQVQLTKDKGKLRYEVDRVALKLFYSLKPEELFNAARNKKEIALGLENIAKKMLKRDATPLDTILEILKEAQRYSFSKERQELINKLIKEIPEILKERFDSELRLTQDEKAKIKREVKSKKEAVK